MKSICIILSFLFLSQVYAQKQNFRSKSDIGIMAGGSYYIGDLNKYQHFKNTQLAFGFLYRYNLNPRVAIRANFNYGSVKAADSEAKNPVLVNRNLSFSSEIYEVATGFEFNYFPFQIGHSRYRGTAYLLAEIGLFHMNPVTEYNGDKIELQSLGTEGQGTPLSSKGNYSKTQLCIPLAVGFKLAVGRNMSLGIEYGIRKTFTDNLDDVNANRYVNPDDLAAISGPMAAALANRSLDGSRYGKRGDTTTKDWYAFFGATLSFRLGGPKKCSQPK